MILGVIPCGLCMWSVHSECSCISEYFFAFPHAHVRVCFTFEHYLVFLDVFGFVCDALNVPVFLSIFSYFPMLMCVFAVLFTIIRHFSMFLVVFASDALVLSQWHAVYACHNLLYISL